jgi:hypothetical protein
MKLAPPLADSRLPTICTSSSISRVATAPNLSLPAASAGDTDAFPGNTRALCNVFVSSDSGSRACTWAADGICSRILSLHMRHGERSTGVVQKIRRVVEDSSVMVGAVFVVHNKGNKDDLC